MDEQVLRLECLRLANGFYLEDADHTVQVADKFYEFVSGIKQANGQYSFHLGEQG